AIGAKVRVKTVIHGKSLSQVREINSGMAFGQGPLEAHFGLGDATNVDTLRIEWPSGTVQEFQNISAKQILTITEPSRLFVQVTNSFPTVFLNGGRNLRYAIYTSMDMLSWYHADSITITNLNGITPVLWCEICRTNSLPSAPTWFVRARLSENP